MKRVRHIRTEQAYTGTGAGTERSFLWGVGILNDFLSEARCRDFANSIIFRLFKQIQTFEPRSEFIENIPAVSTKLRVIESYIQKAGQQLEAIKDFSEHRPEVDDALKTFDEIIMRIHFALESKQRIANNFDMPANEENRKDLYF